MLEFFKYLVESRKYVSIAGIFIVLAFFITAIFAPLLYDWSAVTIVNLADALEPPSGRFPFGADELGRDMVGRIIWGARISLIVAMAAVAFALVVGVVIGGITGFFEGPLSFIVMRGIDVLISFPRILVAIIMIALLGTGLTSMTIAIGISEVPIFARLFRGPVLSLKKRDYVVAAQSLGATDTRLLIRHILPNTISILIVQVSIALAQAVLMASGLSFLGLGPQPPIPEWGAMIASSRSYMVSSPHLMFVPGLALFLVILSFNVVGDALRDFFDPKSNDFPQ